MPDTENGKPWAQTSDLVSAIVQHVKETPSCDFELLAILESHILKLDPSETAVSLAFKDIQTLAKMRAKVGGFGV